MTDARCPICHQLADRPHDALLHQRHDEQAADGYTPCGCDPDGHDQTGPCDRGEGHVGICTALLTDLPVDDEDSTTVDVVVAFACRDDDSTPHPLVPVRAVE